MDDCPDVTPRLPAPTKSLPGRRKGPDESLIQCPGVNASISYSPPFQMSVINNPEVIASKNGTASFVNHSQKYPRFFAQKSHP
ncbi:hypothetical protein AVEN_74198-1 [Araneus ventricosus]|uniref:Uncharacterized protein n=1 Tax=Araneus ventricosus TaxID=182803 RepID=A0A4Y2IBY0_ARAVE|nr:hypothetical protein AVEN_74198-1 [Araneus ventricosus]